MVHHIAELIRESEDTEAVDLYERRRRCADAILALWRHRRDLPNGVRPFEEMEPILRALQSLDPEDETPRFFRSLRPPAGETVSAESKSWLEIADGLDYSAKTLIRHCLMRAAEASLDKSQEWVALAQAVGEHREIEHFAVRLLAKERNELAEELRDTNRELIEGRLKRLEGIGLMLEGYVSDLRASLSSRDSGGGGSETET